MDAEPPTCRRAARYVRMSTEHQRYSIDNQIEAIDAYALASGMEIVRTYADPGRSGLQLKGRPGLQSLLIDVQSGQTDFDCLIVYDVSRWGRFQDTDESAFYAHLCARSGVEIIYCAEPFQDYDGVLATIVKSVKRAMAAEYSRELSTKVFNGQAAIVRRGFRAGATAGYAFERWVVDEAGVRKRRLQPGQSKALTTDRVILAPGPPEEVALVQLIFQLYVHEGQTQAEIARNLRNRGVSRRGQPWKPGQIGAILACEKFIGNSLYNRISKKLGAPERRNAQDQWVRREDAWQPTIDRSTYERARARLAELRPRRWTDEEILDRLAGLLQRKGKLTADIIVAEPSMPALEVIGRRFGGLGAVYDRLGYGGGRRISHVNVKREQWRVRQDTVRAIDVALRRIFVIAQLEMALSSLRLNGLTARVVTPFIRISPSGLTQWVVRLPPSFDAEALVAVRIDPTDRMVLDYYVVASAALRHRHLFLPLGSIADSAVRCSTVADVAEILCRLRGSRRSQQDSSRLLRSRGSPRRQTEYAQCMNTPHERLKQARITAGFDSASQAAERLGVPLATYQQHENGIRGIPAKRAALYGTFFKAAPEWILYGRGSGPGGKGSAPVIREARHVPIVGTAAANVWGDGGQVDSLGDSVPVDLPAFEQNELFALRVHGPGMDEHYLPSAVVIASTLKGLEVRSGDHVIVRRRQGAMVEVSIREVAAKKGGAELWARSSDARLHEPLILSAKQDDQTLQIAGVVIASYYVRPASTGPVIALGKAA